MRSGEVAVPEEVVVLVHGLWLNGWEMAWLGNRLARCGFSSQRFFYHSVRRTPTENARALARFLESVNATRVHLLAHSLGGVVLLHLFHDRPRAVNGRVLMLGTPLHGSAVAGRLASRAWSRRLLGRSIEQGLLGDAPDWQGEVELGVIAGTRNIGMGRVTGGLEGPADGAVAVSETRAVFASDVLLLPTTHTGMLFSAAVARACCRFLRNGSFSGAPSIPAAGAQ